jgi:hypothetical protein
LRSLFTNRSIEPDGAHAPTIRCADHVAVPP